MPSWVATLTPTLLPDFLYFSLASCSALNTARFSLAFSTKALVAVTWVVARSMWLSCSSVGSSLSKKNLSSLRSLADSSDSLACSAFAFSSDRLVAILFHSINWVSVGTFSSKGLKKPVTFVAAASSRAAKDFSWTAKSLSICSSIGSSSSSSIPAAKNPCSFSHFSSSAAKLAL